MPINPPGAPLGPPEHFNNLSELIKSIRGAVSATAPRNLGAVLSSSPPPPPANLSGAPGISCIFCGADGQDGVTFLWPNRCCSLCQGSKVIFLDPGNGLLAQPAIKGVRYTSLPDQAFYGSLFGSQDDTLSSVVENFLVRLATLEIAPQRVLPVFRDAFFVSSQDAGHPGAFRAGQLLRGISSLAASRVPVYFTPGEANHVIGPEEARYLLYKKETCSVPPGMRIADAIFVNQVAVALAKKGYPDRSDAWLSSIPSDRLLNFVKAVMGDPEDPKNIAAGADPPLKDSRFSDLEV